MTSNYPDFDFPPIKLAEGFTYFPGFLANDLGTGLLTNLWNDLEWESREIFLFGKKVMQPRLMAWCSDPGINYQYSGLVLEPTKWHSGLEAVRKRLFEATNNRFNSVLANAYRNGRDSMGWHADNEKALGDKPVVASISLGEKRRFLIRPCQGGRSVGVDLEHGSLLLMTGDSQENWQHCVPKTKTSKGLRINLTYRLIRESRSM
jgi:alkylated DNA repair dioxygenase AlkB